MKAISKTLTIMLVGLFIMQALAAFPAQELATDVRIHLSGPAVLGVEKSGHYYATLVDPQNREWVYKVFVTAENTTGASPLEASPVTGNLTAENKTFEFDLTSQAKSGDLVIHVNCTSVEDSSWFESTDRIDVVTPVVIKTMITNPTDTQINNATVNIYVDGVKIDDQTLSLAPNQGQEVSADWIVVEKTPGWHDFKFEVDLNSDGVIDVTAGDTVMADKFYVEGGGTIFLWLIIFAGLLALVAGFYFISKRKLR
jgi:hypothetical protein